MFKLLKLNWKAVSLIASVVTATASLVSTIADGKKTEASIKDEVSKAVNAALGKKG